MRGTWRITDPVLVLLALVATFVGLFLIFDAGYARSVGADRGFFPSEFKTQLVCLPVALGFGAICACLNPKTFRKLGVWLFLFGSVLLVLVLKFGHAVNGAQRWLGFGPVSVQPAELMKFATVLFLAGVFCNREAWRQKMERHRDWGDWMDDIAVRKAARALPALLVLGAIVLIEREPDLGTASVVAVIAFALFAFGGVSRTSLAVMVFLALAGSTLMIRQEPYRWDRIRTHGQRWQAANVDDSSYQTVHSELAMATGGIRGLGLGNGRAKEMIPEPTTDFIMATVGEEFGLSGSLLILGLMGAITFRLVQLAGRQTTSSFASLVLYGTATWIGVQASVNVMMANGFLPAIGIPLPFISYGGSSLVALWCAVGLCQSALSVTPPAPARPDSREAVPVRPGPVSGQPRWAP